MHISQAEQKVLTVLDELPLRKLQKATLTMISLLESSFCQDELHYEKLRLLFPEKLGKVLFYFDKHEIENFEVPDAELRALSQQAHYEGECKYSEEEGKLIPHGYGKVTDDSECSYSLQCRFYEGKAFGAVRMQMDDQIEQGMYDKENKYTGVWTLESNESFEVRAHRYFPEVCLIHSISEKEYEFQYYKTFVRNIMMWGINWMKIKVKENNMTLILRDEHTDLAAIRFGSHEIKYHYTVECKQTRPNN